MSIPKLNSIHSENQSVLNELLDENGLVPFRESRTVQFTGSRALMLAILEDAIRYFLNTPESKPSFREAERWITDENFVELFSFENICFHLGLDPDATRKTLLRMRGDENPTLYGKQQKRFPTRVRQNVTIPKQCTSKGKTLKRKTLQSIKP